jgi:hypothetical protein
VRIPRCAIVGAILSAIFIMGCDSSSEPKPVDLKGKADTSNLKGMLDQQTSHLKTGTQPPKAAPTP